MASLSDRLGDLNFSKKFSEFADKINGSVRKRTGNDATSLFENIETGNRYDNSDGDRGVLPSALTGLYGRLNINGASTELRQNSYIDVMTMLSEMNPKDFCDFNGLMGAFMNRLMQININEKDITLGALGQDAAINGDSNRLSPDIPRYSYTEGRNYLDFVERARMTSGSDMSTRTTNNVDTPYYTNGNEIYRYTENLYPDDNGTGTFSNKWNVASHRNSILYKTKRLFAQGKINSLISRFGTNADPLSTPLDYTGRKGTRVGGESRGRNLLAKDTSKNYNGYNNPYCRVWTHHHQYDRVSRMIRPFGGDSTLEKMHAFPKVNPVEGSSDQTKFDTKGWRYSVMSNDGESNYNGFVNITPKFLGGAEKNIHTKQCMLSIENLAWRGYNPYEFEKALSWEQRGPLGGRIMWFPPYGLTFNETSNANWSSNSFIGRGEDVYTYVNTQRTGSLSFILLIDHPSILDYATWNDYGRYRWGGDTDRSSNGVTDEKILQFFAGCDSADGGDASSLFHDAKETPLTDEYKYEFVPGEIITPQLVPEPEKPEPKPEDEPPREQPDSVEFYIFFPNNYSGYYDYPNNPNGDVDAVMYLMAGTGAQMDLTDGTIRTMRISADQITEDGTGYEIDRSLSTDNTTMMPRLKPAKGGYTALMDDGWHYRVDGVYVQKKNKLYTISGRTEGGQLNDTNKNTLAQKLKYSKNDKYNHYEDEACLGLNKSVSAVRSNLKINDETPNLYSASEVICAALRYKNKTTAADKVKSKVESRQVTIDGKQMEAVDALVKLFNEREISEVEAHGYASTDGSTNASVRNQFLAEQRSNTIATWLENICGFKKGVTDGNGPDGVGYDKNKENSPLSKASRYAKVIIKFVTESKQDAAKVDGGQQSETTSEPAETTTPEISSAETAQQNADKTIEKLKGEYLKILTQEDEQYYGTWALYRFLYSKWDQDVHSNMSHILSLIAPFEFNTDLTEFASKKVDEYIGWANDSRLGGYNAAYEPYINGAEEIGALLDTEGTYEEMMAFFEEKKNGPDGEWYKNFEQKLMHEQIGNDERVILAYAGACLFGVLYMGYIKNFFKEIKDYTSTLPQSDAAAEQTDASISDANKANKISDTSPSEATVETGQRVSKYVGYNEVLRPDGSSYNPKRYRTTNDGEDSIWIDVGDGKLQKITRQYKARFANNDAGIENDKDEYNKYRYDQEYYFYRKLERESPLVFQRLVDKLKYFDPAFHSMTPEGFNGRLTFLHQCTRQGNTVTMSDSGGKTANNLAFGRPPFCVLRIGDFVNQMVIINNVNFDYTVSEGITWDLNPEGAGVQPMLCRVTLTLTLIGGSDLAGPIRRLQNAMSFNYYANARLYDNRADRVMYNSEGDARLEGAVDWEINKEQSYSYRTAMYNKQDPWANWIDENRDRLVESAKTEVGMLPQIDGIKLPDFGGIGTQQQTDGADSASSDTTRQRGSVTGEEEPSAAGTSVSATQRSANDSPETPKPNYTANAVDQMKKYLDALGRDKSYHDSEGLDYYHLIDYIEMDKLFNPQVMKDDRNGNKFWRGTLEMFETNPELWTGGGNKKEQ